MRSNTAIQSCRASCYRLLPLNKSDLLSARSVTGLSSVARFYLSSLADLIYALFQACFINPVWKPLWRDAQLNAQIFRPYRVHVPLEI
jgi:hypothetical protein